MRAERGISAFEQRHKVVVAGVFESPRKGVAGSNLADRIFSGFTISLVFRANSSRRPSICWWAPTVTRMIGGPDAAV